MQWDDARGRAASPSSTALTTPSAPTPPPSLRELDLEAHLRDPARRQRFVTPMFDIIAPRYDDFTRLFSFGMDAGWKREAIDATGAPLEGGTRVLDLACGTGDLAFALAARHPAATVTGLDASPRMISEAEARRRRDSSGARVRVLLGDLCALPLPDASVELVTAGYALRNVPDWRAGVAEIARVLRPGGRLVTLDFYRPRAALWRLPFLGYLAAAGHLVGRWWHGEGVVYGY
ncbi:MAG TPA: class I SAM-dependent methyltransferase, partial [Gemmatimonadales bacterium]|nr:class I SAM-dependent methyltransferase [Gemmatimonadales bacterium]